MAWLGQTAKYLGLCQSDEKWGGALDPTSFTFNKNVISTAKVLAASLFCLSVVVVFCF